MTISSTTRKAGPFVGNGSTTSFPFTFKVFAAADVYVVKQLTSSGAETVLTLNTDYTVSLNADQNASPGGSVVLASALASTYTLTLTSAISELQPTNLTNQGGFYPTVINDSLDRATILVQQVKEKLDRSIKYPVTDASIGTELPSSALRANKVLSFDANGAPTTPFSAADVQNAQSNASAAAASAAAALASETAAASSQSAAASSASSAATSASAAATAAASVIWNDVVFANSNVSVDATYRGKLIAVDATSGPVTVTLPQISTLDLVSGRFVVGVKKTDSSLNAVTISRSGSDTINGSISKVIFAADAGTTLIPDVDPNPDQWTGLDFGAVAGNLTQDKFSGTGAQTAFTLSVSPGSKNNTQVFISGVYQSKDNYSVSGTTLTFTAAPPSGTNNIEVITGTTLTIGTPADNTVGTAKLIDQAVTTAKIADSATTLAKLAAAVANALVPAGSVMAFAGSAAPTGYLVCDGAAVSRSTYSALFSAIGTAHGNGDGSTTFNLPDYRGRFLRGVDGSASRDPDKASRSAMASGGSTGNGVGSVQDDAFQGHWHNLGDASGNTSNARPTATAAGAATTIVAQGTGAGWLVSRAIGAVDDGTNGTPRTSSETRVKNAYVNYIIKT